MRKKWTDRERKIQAWRCRQNKPWEKSTGPKSNIGKNIVRDNALKHGLRSVDGSEFLHVLAAQKRFITAVMLQKYAEGNKRE